MADSLQKMQTPTPGRRCSLTDVPGRPVKAEGPPCNAGPALRCINRDAEGACWLTEAACPFAGPGADDAGRPDWRGCREARVGIRVQLAPDEFLVIATPDGRPAAGRFPLRRCRATRVEEAAGVHVSSLLTSLGDAALMDATELDAATVLLTTRDGNTSLLWKSGRFLPG